LSVDAASILAGTTEHARIKVAQVHEATGRVQPYVAKRPAADSYAKRQQLQQIGRQNAVQAPPDASYRINNQIVGNAHQQQHEIVTIPRPNSNSLVVNGENKQQQQITARVEEDEDGFMCEWDCCGKWGKIFHLFGFFLLFKFFRTFYSPETLLHHTTNFHLLNRKPPDPPKKGKGRRPAANKQQKKVVDPELDTSTNEQFLCKWPFCTDTISRTLWSMVTHLQAFSNMTYIYFWIYAIKKFIRKGIATRPFSKYL
jgi:hypothetical protein